MYISPNRNLLYVTDTFTSTFEENPNPSHSFEHLSCFLPGLLALGAHTLKLDNIPSLGIPGVKSLTDLGNQTTFGHGGRGYEVLSRFKSLKELHMWAAEGLAQTCWLIYADQPTGLGADSVIMDTIFVTGGMGEEIKKETKTLLWMDAVDKWRKGGRRGVVPGLAPKRPVIFNEKDEPSTRRAKRDYSIMDGRYLLRPEVSSGHEPLI